MTYSVRCEKVATGETFVDGFADERKAMLYTHGMILFGCRVWVNGTEHTARNFNKVGGY